MTKDEWYKQLFEHLEASKFRSSFHLKQKDIDYINEKGLDVIRKHAQDFIAKRETPAVKVVAKSFSFECTIKLNRVGGISLN